MMTVTQMTLMMIKTTMATRLPRLISRSLPPRFPLHSRASQAVLAKLHVMLNRTATNPIVASAIHGMGPVGGIALPMRV